LLHDDVWHIPALLLHQVVEHLAKQQGYFDHDANINLADFASFQASFTGG